MNKLLNRIDYCNLYDDEVFDDLMREIEMKRTKLNCKIERNEDNINSNEILELSKELDRLIVECLRMQYKLNSRIITE